MLFHEGVSVFVSFTDAKIVATSAAAATAPTRSERGNRDIVRIGVNVDRGVAGLIGPSPAPSSRAP